MTASTASMSADLAETPSGTPSSPESGTPSIRTRWTPNPTNSEKHRKGRPTPRTSPRRLPRALAFSAGLVAFAASRLFPAPGSNLERLHPKTRVLAVLDELPIPAHLRGTLQALSVPADGQTCSCLWRSYDQLAGRLEREPRTVILHVAELESLQVVHTKPRQDPRGGNLPNDFRLQVPPLLRELAAQHVAQHGHAPPPRASRAPAPLAEEPADVASEAGEEEPEPAGEDEAAEIAAAKAELLARPPAPSSPAADVAPLPPPARPPSAVPLRPNVAPPPLLRPENDPAVAEGAVLELLRDRQHAFASLREPLETFAGRLTRDLIEDERISLPQVLVGLWECSTLPGPTGQGLAGFAVRCIRQVRDASAQAKPVKKILRRVEKGETIASLAGGARAPPPG